MSVIIKGMEMPPSCSECLFVRLGSYEYILCYLLDEEGNYLSRLKNCPLVELPSHGDLIDRDAFREENEYYLNREFINPKYEDTLDDLLKDAPVVIPAERSGDE